MKDEGCTINSLVKIIGDEIKASPVPRKDGHSIEFFKKVFAKNHAHRLYPGIREATVLLNAMNCNKWMQTFMVMKLGFEKKYKERDLELVSYEELYQMMSEFTESDVIVEIVTHLENSGSKDKTCRQYMRHLCESGCLSLSAHSIETTTIIERYEREYQLIGDDIELFKLKLAIASLEDQIITEEYNRNIFIIPTFYREQAIYENTVGVLKRDVALLEIHIFEMKKLTELVATGIPFEKAKHLVSSNEKIQSMKDKIGSRPEGLVDPVTTEPQGEPVSEDVYRKFRTDFREILRQCSPDGFDYRNSIPQQRHIKEIIYKEITGSMPKKIAEARQNTIDRFYEIRDRYIRLMADLGIVIVTQSVTDDMNAIREDWMQQLAIHKERLQQLITECTEYTQKTEDFRESSRNVTLLEQLTARKHELDSEYNTVRSEYIQVLIEHGYADAAEYN